MDNYDDRIFAKSLNSSPKKSLPTRRFFAAAGPTAEFSQSSGTSGKITGTIELSSAALCPAQSILFPRHSQDC